MTDTRLFVSLCIRMIDLKNVDIGIAVSEKMCSCRRRRSHIDTAESGSQMQPTHARQMRSYPGNRNRHQIPVQLVHNPAAVKAEIGIDPVFLIIVTDQLSGFLILFQSHKIKSQIIVKYFLSRIRRMICSGEGAQFCGCAFMCFNHCSTSCKCKNPACSKKVTS